MWKRKLLILLSGLLFVLPLPMTADAQSFLHEWSDRFGDSYNQQRAAIATDGSGNVILTGDFAGTVDFGGGALSSAGIIYEDYFIAKFDPDGNHVWSKHFGDVDPQAADAVAIDGADNVIVTGLLMGTIDFGGGGLTSTGGHDIFVAKFDPDGNHIWSKRFGDGSNQFPRGVTSDASGNVIVMGYFESTVDFGGGGLTSAGLNDVFVAKFDPDGNHIWSKRFGDASQQYAQGTDTDDSGNVYVTGQFEGTVDFGGGGLTSAGSSDIFVVKIDAGGNHLWSKHFGDANSQWFRDVECDGPGNVIVTGYIKGTVNFGGGDLTSAGGWDVVIAKLDSGGNHLWSKRFGDAGNDQFAVAVTTDARNDVFVTGSFWGSLDLGGGPLTSAGGVDIFVVQFDAAGNHISSDSFGDADHQEGTDVAAHGMGRVIVVGDLRGSADFGGGPLTSAGDKDIFVTELVQAAPRIACVRDVPGDQGGWVNLCWDASGDDTPTGQITRYTYWRAIQPTQVSSWIASGASVVADPSAAAGALNAETPLIRVQRVEGDYYYWYLVGSLDAHHFEGYSAPVATLFDSTAVCTEYHYFQVIAHTADPSLFWVSAPDSGYSVDNLSPAAPLNFAGAQTQAQEMQLTWDPNVETDLSHYALHRDTEPGFTPGADNLIGEPSVPELIDDQWSWDAGYYYKVAAVDANGNKSDYAELGPEGVTGGGSPGVPDAFALGQNVPNPFNPTTTIQYDVSAGGGAVTLQIFDVSGRLVRTLVDGRQTPGSKSVVWNGTNDRGQGVASGIYFYRMTAPQFLSTRKMVLLQ